MNNRYTVRNNRGHYDIFCDGLFVGSADTRGEAMRDIEKMEEDDDVLQLR